MNRQVIPSMLLSVFIVCFFSVLLYDHDKSPSTGGPFQAKAKAEPAPAAPEQASASPSARPDVPIPDSPAPAAAKQPAASESDRSEAPVPAAPAPKAAEPGAVTPPADPPAPSPTESAPPAPSPPAVEPASLREPPRTTIPAATETPHEPRSTFTTTREGESLADVAVRVYGSAEKADTLWRANRDLLPHRDSPLSAGAVLRTPAE